MFTPTSFCARDDISQCFAHGVTTPHVSRVSHFSVENSNRLLLVICCMGLKEKIMKSCDPDFLTVPWRIQNGSYDVKEDEVSDKK